MLKDEIQKQMHSSLKKGESFKVNTLRYILSQIKYAEINKQADLNKEEAESLLAKEIKKRRESIELFRKGGRNELAEAEENEIKIISEYLPPQLTDEQLSVIIDRVIEKSGDVKNPGKIIGLTVKEVSAGADPANIARIVNDKLSKSPKEPSFAKASANAKATADKSEGKPSKKSSKICAIAIKLKPRSYFFLVFEIFFTVFLCQNIFLSADKNTGEYIRYDCSANQNN